MFCCAKTKAGTQCKKKRTDGSSCCTVHKKIPASCCATKPPPADETTTTQQQQQQKKKTNIKTDTKKKLCKEHSDILPKNCLRLRKQDIIDAITKSKNMNIKPKKEPSTEEKTRQFLDAIYVDTNQLIENRKQEPILSEEVHDNNTIKDKIFKDHRTEIDELKKEIHKLQNIVDKSKSPKDKMGVLAALYNFITSKYNMTLVVSALLSVYFLYNIKDVNALVNLLKDLVYGANEGIRESKELVTVVPTVAFSTVFGSKYLPDIANNVIQTYMPKISNMVSGIASSSTIVSSALTALKSTPFKFTCSSMFWILMNKYFTAPLLESLLGINATVNEGNLALATPSIATAAVKSQGGGWQTLEILKAIFTGSIALSSYLLLGGGEKKEEPQSHKMYQPWKEDKKLYLNKHLSKSNLKIIKRLIKTISVV